MITEDLNEMIQEVPSNPMDFNDPDFIYTLPRKKLAYDEVKDDALKSEKQIAESTIPQGEIGVVVDSSTKEIMESSYQPESEEALITYATGIHKKCRLFQ
jgi:hypothetical protein